MLPETVRWQGCSSLCRILSLSKSELCS